MIIIDRQNSNLLPIPHKQIPNQLTSLQEILILPYENYLVQLQHITMFLIFNYNLDYSHDRLRRNPNSVFFSMSNSGFLLMSNTDCVSVQSVLDIILYVIRYPSISNLPIFLESILRLNTLLTSSMLHCGAAPDTLCQSRSNNFSIIFVRPPFFHLYSVMYPGSNSTNPSRLKFSWDIWETP